MGVKDRHGRFFAQSLTERREMILEGNTFKVLLLLSLPTLLMGFVSALIPLTDGLFINNSAGYIAAGAVGYSMPVINMLNAVSLGLGAAAMALVGQLYGQGDFRKVRHASEQIMVSGFAIGLLMTPLMLLAARVISSRMDAELGAMVMRYLGLYSINMPLFFLAALYNSIRNATGQPEATFYRMLILFILKLVFNSVYLVIFRLGVVGAALGSISSYLVITIWMYNDLFHHGGEMQLSLKGFRLDRAQLTSLLRLGIPTMLSNFMINLGFFLINQEIVSYGKIVLNAQTIASNLNSMSFTLPSSIATTVTTMVSMKMAMGQEAKARRSFLDGCLLSLLISVVILAVYLPAAPSMVRHFLNNPDMDPALAEEILSIAVYALRIYSWAILGFGVFMVSQGAMIGLAKTKIPLIGGILRVWLFRYLFILAFREKMGYRAVFWGNLLSNVLAALVMFVILLRSDWRKDLLITTN